MGRKKSTHAKDTRSVKTIVPIANGKGVMKNIDYAHIIRVSNARQPPINATNAAGTRKRADAERSC